MTAFWEAKRPAGRSEKRLQMRGFNCWLRIMRLGNVFEKSKPAGTDLLAETLKIAIPQTGPELVLGLIAPLGVDLDGVRDALRASFAMFEYRLEYVTVSDWLKEFAPELIKREVANQPEHKRIEDLQDTGNALRDRIADPSAAATLACLEIRIG